MELFYTLPQILSPLFVLAAIALYYLVKYSLPKVLEQSIKVGFDRNIESFKKTLQVELANEVEPLKASLSKENISFQVTHTEYIKRQYIHLEELFGRAYELRIMIRNKIKKAPISYEESNIIKKDMTDLLNSYVQKTFVSSFYLDEDSRKIMFNYADEAIILLNKFIKYHDSIRRFDYLEEIGFAEANQTSEDDYEYIEYTQEQIDVMKADIESLLRECNEKKHSTETIFSAVDGTIKKFLYKPTDSLYNIDRHIVAKQNIDKSPE